jgi:hypothetical protein
MAEQPIYLLWTGGWDSTFRVLQVVWELELPLQPYYLIDHDRPSLAYELRAMHNIRTAVAKKNPQAGQRILPLRYRALADIPPHEPTTTQFQQMHTKAFMAPQYEWLVRLAVAEALPYLEIGIQGQTTGLNYWQGNLHANLVPYQRADGQQVFVVSDTPNPPELTFFSHFQFPIARISKVQIQAWAAQQGLAEIMEMSWFCHRPRRNGTPCGLCTPCKVAMIDGMAHRLPPASKVRYYLKKGYYRLKGQAW